MFTKTQVSQSVIDSVSKILQEDDCVTPMQSKKIADKEVEKHEKHMHKGKKPTFEAKKMEEDELGETGFHMAAHAAKKAGQPHFTFQGKKYPVTAKSTAECMEEVEEASTFDWKANKDEKDPKFTTKKPGERTGHDSKKTATGTVYTKKPTKDTEVKEESEVSFKEKLLEKNWIAGAIKKPGAETAAAKKAGMSVQDYAHKHAHDPGKAGKRARLAITLKKMHKEEKTFDELLEDLNDAQVDKLIFEVLGKDATAGDYIHDFIHSKNPKFAGKSKEERKKMALGAYYGKQNEEVEQIDELSKSTLGSYVKSAAKDVGASRSLATDFERNAKSAKNQRNKDANKRLSDKFKSTAMKRHAGIDKAVGRLTKEDSELDEGMMDTVKKVGGKVLKTLGHGSDADMRKDLQRKAGLPQTGEKPKKEAVEPSSVTTDTLAGPVKGGKPNQHSSIKVKLKAESASTPMDRARELAKKSMKKVKTEMLGKTGTSE